MEKPLILLDENLIWCCSGPDRSVGDLLKEELASLGIPREAVYYVGELTMQPEHKAGIQPETFRAEFGNLASIARSVAEDCEGRSPTDPGQFKRCVADGFELVYQRGAADVIRGGSEERYSPDVREGIGNRTRFRVPPLGSRDVDIRSWAEKNSILIVSADRGADLEPNTGGDRVAVRSERCPCGDFNAMRAYAKSMAKAIDTRLREIKNVLRVVKD